MAEKNRSPDQKTGIIINDQIDRGQLSNPGYFSLIDKKELTKDIPGIFKFETMNLKAAAARLDYSISQMRVFCQENIGNGVEIKGAGYQLNRWRVEALAVHNRHVKSRQRTIFDIVGVKTNGR